MARARAFCTAALRAAMEEGLVAPETARGGAKETVLIMGGGECCLANGFIDSSDAKYSGAPASAKWDLRALFSTKSRDCGSPILRRVLLGKTLTIQPASAGSAALN